MNASPKQLLNERRADIRSAYVALRRDAAPKQALPKALGRVFDKAELAEIRAYLTEGPAGAPGRSVGIALLRELERSWRSQGSVGVSEDWTKTRKTVLGRDAHCCRDCGAREDDHDLDVHHLVPRSAGGGDAPSNLITLCDGCHGARHPNLQVSLSRRMIERWALRLARLLDRQRELPNELDGLPAVLRVFGKERFREGQLDAVMAALRGESMIVVRPTGSGKSICFQVPAVMRGGTTVVLSPLKALMQDQVMDLQSLKLPATFVNGDLSPQEKKVRYDLLKRNAFKLFYVAPERFNREALANPAEVDIMKRLRPTFLVVDEAHCVDKWGKDFRPDYSRIAEIRREIGNPPVLAFTATAGREAQGRILQSLGVPEAARFVAEANRPNIALIRHRVPVGKGAAGLDARATFIIEQVRNLRGRGKAMIFVPTVKVGESLKRAMARHGMELPFYHAKLAPNAKANILGQFQGSLEPPLRAVICTNAFGMGIDVPDVRLVINWQHPSSVEDYVQEFGRGGRDGQPALAIVLTEGGREKGLLEWMADRTAEGAADGSTAEAALAQKRRDIATINELVTSERRCFRRALMEHLGEGGNQEAVSLARRLIDWVFGERQHMRRATLCCDGCSKRMATRVLIDGLR